MEEMIIRRPDDLIRLLLKLREAKEDKYSDDPRQVYFSQSKKKDQEVFDLDEEDENPEGEETAGDEEPPAPPPAPRPEAQAAQPAPAPRAPAPEKIKSQTNKSPPDDLKPSLDGIVRSINQLRGGKSTKDAEDELSVYYDRLEDPTRKALYAFVNSLSGILTDQMTGTTAIDPEDPPMNISISVSPGAEEGEDEEKDEAPAESEDTTPPIVAGQKQVKEGVKKRLSLLMRR